MPTLRAAGRPEVASTEGLQVTSDARATYGADVEVSGPPAWKSVAFSVTIAGRDHSEAQRLLVREVERQTGGKVELSELRVERRWVPRLGSQTGGTYHLHTEGVLAVRDE